jgi:hypothetical protein
VLKTAVGRAAGPRRPQRKAELDRCDGQGEQGTRADLAAKSGTALEEEQRPQPRGERVDRPHVRRPEQHLPRVAEDQQEQGRGQGRPRANARPRQLEEEPDREDHTSDLEKPEPKVVRSGRGEEALVGEPHGQMQVVVVRCEEVLGAQVRIRVDAQPPVGKARVEEEVIAVQPDAPAKPEQQARRADHR